MRFSKRISWMLFAGTALGALLLFISFATQTVQANNPDQIESETCLGCHEDFDKVFEHSPHRVSSQISGTAVEIVCACCHVGAEIHVEDPSRDNMLTPLELEPEEATAMCSQCHTAHTGIDNYGFDAHSVEEINCVECHLILKNDKSLTLDDQTDFCIRCHIEKGTSINQVTSHPMSSGEVSCLSCHRMNKRLDAFLGYDLAGTCAECHPRQSGPFPYEHDVAHAYSVEGGGCIECHNPHGSVNNHLLNQPKENLCLQCHMKPPGHQSSTVHGFVWSQYDDCTVCHSETHGSFVSSLFLDPDLPAKFGTDCYQSGCHNLNR